MYKIRFLFLNLQRMGKVIRAFCWHQKFVPNGVVCPCPGAIYMYKIIKNVYKIRFRRDQFETCNRWAKWLGLSFDISICPQGLVCPCPVSIYMYKSIEIYTRTRCQVSIYRTTGPLVNCLVTVKPFILVSSKFGRKCTPPSWADYFKIMQFFTRNWV